VHLKIELSGGVGLDRLVAAALENAKRHSTVEPYSLNPTALAMTPFYGHNEPPAGDFIPDWLLGGNRKRRVLAALAAPPAPAGWKPSELATTLGCGRTTVFETVRALRSLHVVTEDGAGHVRLDPSTPLGDALIELLRVVDAFADTVVDRPPRARGGT
jgi:hypothetical protein